jgi:hypothetical protein
MQPAPHYLGDVRAADEKAAEAKAAVEFNVSGEQRRRLCGNGSSSWAEHPRS